MIKNLSIYPRNIVVSQKSNVTALETDIQVIAFYL